MILLPGTNFASAGRFVSSGSADALIKITNPDSTTTGLVLDLHKYLDVDNSGTHAECTTDNIADAFQISADFLRANNRQALVSETGAGSTASCFTAFCAQNAFLNQNSDVFLGYIAWGAGSFSTSYVLSLTPSKQNGVFVDAKLASQCVVSPWLNAASVTVTTSTKASSTAGGGSSQATSGATNGVTSGAASTLATTASVPVGTGNVSVKASGTGAIVSSSGTGNLTATRTSSSSPSSTVTKAVSSAGAGIKKVAGGLLAGGLFLATIL
jgi:endoglucanase